MFQFSLYFEMKFIFVMWVYGYNAGIVVCSDANYK